MPVKRIPAEIAVEMAQHYTDDALTKREMQVLREVAAGNANKMVAQLLHVSEETVKAHMKSVLSKLGANDRTHAATIAVKRGIIDIWFPLSLCCPSRPPRKLPIRS